MYVILLALGIGKVIFENELKLTDYKEILSSLFVVGVVVDYWWNWAEGVEEVITPTFSELVFDLLIILNLTFLLAHYKDLELLPWFFFYLGVCDLLWVINHSWDYRKEKGRCHKRRFFWLFEKVSAIAVYFFVAVLFGPILWQVLEEKDSIKFFFEILYQSPIFSSPIFAELWQILVLIFAYLFVRRFCFVDIRRIRGISFKEVEADDLEELVVIHNQQALTNLEGNIKNGFLLKGTTLQNLKAEYLNENNKFFKAIYQDNIIAFIKLAKKIDANVLEKTKWKTEKPDLLDNSNHWYIGCLVLRKKFERRGVGEEVFKELFAFYKGSTFSSFITIAPFNNIPSLKLHKKFKFKEIGTFDAEIFEGIKNYKSVLKILV